MSLNKSFRILVYVGLDLLGDGLMKFSFLRTLRGLFPDAHITWFAGKGKTVFATALKPLSKGLIDEVRDDISYGTYLREIFQPVPFKEDFFDIIIDTQNRIKTTLLLKRIPHQVFISGTADFFFSSKKPSKGAQKPLHLQERLLELLKVLRENTEVELKKAPLILGRAEEKIAEKLLPGKGYVGLVPGAGGRQKCWPLEKYIELAGSLKNKKLKPVFILGPQEKEWEQILKQKVPFAFFPLQEEEAGNPPSLFLTMAIGRRLSVAVSNDCGTGHILAAVDTPLVSLFGPTNAAKFAPFCSYLILLKAQEWGGSEMEKIPLEAVERSIHALLKKQEN